MSTSAEQVRQYTGPAVLSYGFRPFFLGGAAWAALAMAIWVGTLSGVVSLPTAFGMLDWHVHALLYGFLPAIVAGFLLTAVPNWTGRLPVTGVPLAVLALGWLAGRVVIAVSAHIDPLTTALVDGVFLAAVCLVIGREIYVGRNWRNLKVLALTVLVTVGNAAFHWEAAVTGTAWNGYGTRMGVASAVFLIALIGGRIVPSFTRNWLAKRSPGRLPITFNRQDLWILAVSGGALAIWVALPGALPTAALCLVAGGLQGWRLLRWAGERTLAEPLVFILHVGYLFVPIGFVLVAAAVVWPHAVATSAALHAWTVGGIGVMTLAVMTRASLGHSGRALHASAATVVLYLAVIAAAVARIAAGLGVAPALMLDVAAVGWILGFGGFVLVYGPMLLRPRL